MSTQTQNSAPAAPAPGGAAERIGVVDMLRGMALCGILLIHAANFARPGAPPGTGYSGGPLDTLIQYGLILFVEAKFFCLFAGLFGVSFAIQRQSAARRGAPFAPTFRRRLLFLGLFGLAHILLVWEGDILLLYALVGLLLLPFRDAPPERLLRWAAGLLIAPLALFTVAFVALLLLPQHPLGAEWLRTAQAQFNNGFAAARADVIARYIVDDAGRAVVGRVASYLSNVPLLLARLPAVLAMFLIGFAAGNAGVLADVERHRALLRRVRAWGLGAGLLASLLVTVAYAALPPFAAFTALGFNQVLAGPLLALGYAAAFVLFASRPARARRLAPLASYGRMALTNYLLQSTICAMLFYGSGLGLVMILAPHQAIALAVLINAALIVASGIWLRHFRYGPAEWAWRSLTGGTPQPLRLRPRPTPPAPRGLQPQAEAARTDERYRDRSFGAPPSAGRR